MKSWDLSEGGTSGGVWINEEGGEGGEKQTGKGGKSLDLDFFSDDEAAAALFSRRLSDDGDGVARAGAEAAEGSSAWGSGVGAR